MDAFDLGVATSAAQHSTRLRAQSLLQWGIVCAALTGCGVGAEPEARPSGSEAGVLRQSSPTLLELESNGSDDVRRFAHLLSAVIRDGREPDGPARSAFLEDVRDHEALIVGVWERDVRSAPARVRRVLATAIARRPGDETNPLAPPIVDELAVPGDDSRLDALWTACARGRVPPVKATLVADLAFAAVTDGDSCLAAAALVRLGDRGTAEAESTLRRALASPDHRIEALRALFEARRVVAPDLFASALVTDTTPAWDASEELGSRPIGGAYSTRGVAVLCVARAGPAATDEVERACAPGSWAAQVLGLARRLQDGSAEARQIASLRLADASDDTPETLFRLAEAAASRRLDEELSAELVRAYAAMVGDGRRCRDVARALAPSLAPVAGRLGRDRTEPMSNRRGAVAYLRRLGERGRAELATLEQRAASDPDLRGVLTGRDR